MLIVNLTHSAADANCRYHVAAGREYRSSNTAHPDRVLLVIDCVATLTRYRQLLQQSRQFQNRFGRCRDDAMALCDLPNIILTEMTNERFADRGELRRHASTNPDIHLDETGGFDSLDVNRVAVVQDREMRAQSGSLDNTAQMRNRDLAQRHALHRLAAETQHADAESMVAGFGVAAHIATRDQSTQQITRRAFRHVSRATDR